MSMDDAGGIEIDAGPGIDAGAPDAGPPEMSYTFGPCVQDSQCPGAGAFCRTAEVDGWPGGFCSLPCEDRGPCDDGVIYNHCIELEMGAGMQCERRCLNGADCGGFRMGYTCAFQGQIAGAGLCVGICSSDEECGGTSECNEWSGQCHEAGGRELGAETGEGCMRDEDCKADGSIIGACIEERSTMTGAPTGWNGGSCIGPCIMPVGYNTSTFYTDPMGGTDLPTGTCAGDNVCFPNGSFNGRDLGICLAGCRSDADCRAAEGYACELEFNLAGGTARYTRGVCLPISCDERACPAGFTCRTIPTTRGNRFVCERS